ncbi:YjgN family protein [Microvirga pakistanensis]|uniref:YjgN family protein n=1 Tax=Microvirga pakistanensis TaxID=1682650 RepID=UPI00106BB2AE|nr:DUF898 family protein [Microvirga pakistanensis]
MTASLSSNVPLTPHQASPVSFSGRGGEFLKMLVTGSLYQIPTFGFYRFWLITKLRRHLWANTRVEGESFEYTGTAKELLIGFLIALAILAPLYIAIFAVSFLLEEQAAFASIPLFLVLYVLAHFGSYRARKYRATRTVFRGVRFWMKGSGWAYAFRAVLWDFANLSTLGLSLPWAMASLERYRMRHTYFGNVQGDFSGTGWTLFKHGWWLWALSWIALGGSIALSFHLAETFPEHEKTYAGIGPFIAFLLLALLWPLVMAIFTRWHIDGLRFGDAVVSSRLRTGTFYGLFFKVIFSSIGYAVAFSVVFAIGAVVVGLFFQEALAEVQAGEWTGGAMVVATLGAIAYLVFLLGFGIIQRYFFGRGLWAAIANTTSVSNLRSLDEALAAGRKTGGMGEGLADALDFNVGI